MGTPPQSTQLHSHQMEGTLCQVLGIRQSNFGMYRQVARWATPSNSTPLQCTQLHSHLMEDTLCQAQRIPQSKFGMHRQVGRWKMPLQRPLQIPSQVYSHQSTFHLQLYMHCIMLRVFLLTCSISMGTAEIWFICRMMAGLWAPIGNCCYGCPPHTRNCFFIPHGHIWSSQEVILSLT